MGSAQKDLLNLRNLRTSWYQLHSFREVFSQRSECSYDLRPPDDHGFHIPYPVNFDLQILVLANFFSFFKRDVFIVRYGNINQLTRIGFWSSMTKAVLLVEIFLSVIIESHKMVFSFIFTTLCDVCSYHLLGTSQPNSRHTTQ